MNPDEIFIENLVMNTIIGVLPEERIKTQPVELDIRLKANIAQAAESCDLGDTLDYAAIAEGLYAYVESTSFLLIETLAESIVKWLWDFSSAINEITLTLRKPMAVRQAKTVGLRITRCRS